MKFSFYVAIAHYLLSFIKVGPDFHFKNLEIFIWSENPNKNSFYFNNKEINFFFPDISNIPKLISKLSKLTLFL